MLLTNFDPWPSDILVLPSKCHDSHTQQSICTVSTDSNEDSNYCHLVLQHYISSLQYALFSGKWIMQAVTSVLSEHTFIVPGYNT